MCAFKNLLTGHAIYNSVSWRLCILALQNHFIIFVEKTLWVSNTHSVFWRTKNQFAPDFLIFHQFSKLDCYLENCWKKGMYLILICENTSIRYTIFSYVLINHSKFAKIFVFFQVNTSTCLDLFRKKNQEKKSRNQILLWFHEFSFGGIFRSRRKEINKKPETGFADIIKKPAVFWRVFWIRIKIEESMATVLKTSVLTTEISFSSHHES